VMMPQLSAGFGLSAAAVASLVGIFYYGYSPFSLVAGVAVDRLGPRRVVPIGARRSDSGRSCSPRARARWPGPDASCRAREGCSRFSARSTSPRPHSPRPAPQR
jgi:hypothetical protein